MPPAKRKTDSSATAKPVTPYAEFERAVAVYTAAGGQESVQRIVTAISRVGRRLDIYYRQQFLDLDISPGEWSVLTSLAVEGPEGHSTPSHLADVCGVSPSTMTHRLDGMVARELVAREPDATNRTRMQVTLTSAGWELFRRAVTEADVVESNLVTPLDDDERRQLAMLLEKIVAGLRAH
ncbi:DNA-binding MarR family transcriptional regulator [Jatrophihabitans sp. GAS493]|uniref:MarR family winged helix-turn-helix transcriptional regulator n=1 Tax=Jatrophihabitans sp. GAS493 TaxID=1907575 RepID=UPI000BB8279C|nr:MarR family transcriptional regulator [Jatrophihabitans sp. GAS493]SOD71291.1 DNA-binding MarR family transcriptional regulator [Jatrophihabitans sp. GAS493]